MRRYVKCHFSVEGYHCWRDAPPEYEYLSARHRHIFEIDVWYKVAHGNRAIEINDFTGRLKRMLVHEFGNSGESTDVEPCEFGSMSCEMIAEWLLENLTTDAIAAQVSEDGYGGAVIVRK